MEHGRDESKTPESVRLSTGEWASVHVALHTPHLTCLCSRILVCCCL